MLNLIDRFVDRTTMYRLVLYYLAALWGGAWIVGLVHPGSPDPAALSFSLVLILAVGWLANALFCRVFEAVPNRESLFITALILALIIDPAKPGDLTSIGLAAFATLWAMASKFLLSLRGRHIFNPAALGVALAGLLLGNPASWWISGEIWLLPIVLVGGLLVVRKLRRFDLVLAFMLADLATTLGFAAPGDYLAQIRFTLLESPFFFFAFVMLTEPLTAPPARGWRIAYGALVGVLFSPGIQIAGHFFTPELALLVGNLLTLVVSPKGRLRLTLERVEQAGGSAYDFVFRADRPLAFAAGQYLEWTLPVPDPDDRGNRRYFTIASAPTEPLVRLGVKFSPQASAFKRRLAALPPGATVCASQLAGGFVLPRNPNTRLAFVAGGIGITPYRSMLKYLIDRNEARPIVMLYGNNRFEDIAYRDVLDEAERRLGIRTYHAVLEPGKGHGEAWPGVVDEAMIRHYVPDFRERLFYLSGPQPMVSGLRRTLRHMGVPFWRIRTDFFPGLA